VEFSVKSLGTPGITWSRICARFWTPFGIDDVQTVGAEGMNIPPLAIHAVPMVKRPLKHL
jgi:hypothetical protein